MSTKIFQIAAISGNTNSFGLRGVVIVARDGLAFEIGVSTGSHNPKLECGMHVKLDTVPPDEIIGDAVACFDWVTLRVADTGEHITCEIPRALPECPKHVVKSSWTKPRI